ncbi:beta strand repeat-containing protein [Ralstonia wenshanensis]|uniref:beta strand repeat-containing protein n=1 Tax=Ralstonia wenshanensis TaxID=2842456 RepID=UPI003A5AEE31
MTTFATTRAGQNARYTFSATAGQNLSLAWSGATFAGPSSNLSVVDPQGNTVASAWYIGSANQPSGVFQLTNLQKSGTYTVFMDPYQATTGQIGLQLLAPASGTLTVDGPSLAINQVAGATGRYSFAGTAGQTLGLGLDALVTTPSGGYASVAVVAPDKVTTLANCGNFTAPGNSCNLTLPSDGTYTVVVTPSSASTALTGNLTLSNDAAATLVPNAPVTTFATTRAGQNARYTFSATAGQNLSLAWGGSTFASYYSNLSVVDPSGNTVASASNVGRDGQPSGEFQLTNLQKSGTYTVFMDPYQATTGQIGLQLLAPASGTLTVDGPSLAINQVAGATGRYSFAGMAGQTLGLGLDALVTTPSGGYASVAVVAPDKVTALANCGNFTAPGNSCNLTLPSDGTYTVVVTPSSASTALTGNLTLSSDIRDTLSTVTFFSTNRVGQNGRYTFIANAGDNISISAKPPFVPGSDGNSGSGGTISQGGVMPARTTLTIYGPAGNPLASWNVYASTSATVYPLNNLQQSGTFTLFVDPYQTNTGTLDLGVWKTGTTTPPDTSYNGAVSIDGPSLAISQQAGATGRYSFTGTAGQTLGLGLDTLVTTPSGGYASVRVMAPDNVTTLVSCYDVGSAGNSCNLPALPSSGTYTVVVTPGSANTALTGNLTLSNDAAGTLTPNAPVTTFATSRVGQNGRYTFNATAGQNLSLAWTGATFPDSYSTLTVYDPSGNAVANTGSLGRGQPNGVFQLTNLQKSGTYTVFVDLYLATTGQVGLQLLAPASGTLTVDGPSLAISQQAGATGRYSFTGTAGQTLGLGLDTLVTTPSGGYASVRVMAPDNVTTLVSCYDVGSAGNSCNLPALPSSGTYTVVVTPGSANTALTGNLTLSNDAAGTLTPNAPVTTFATSRVGQNGRYTFNATAGQNLSLAWTGATFPDSYSTLTVYDPSGNAVANTGSLGRGQPNGVFQLTNLQKSGTYTVFVDLYLATTGQVGLQLLAPASGTLTVDGPSLAISQQAGATGRYSFTGTAGQTLGLGLDTLVTTPSGGYASVRVMAPDNVTTLVSCSDVGSAGNSCNLPALPSSGTYTVVVTPGSVNTALTGNLTLSNDAAATLTPNAPVTTFATTRAGQNARYTFNATAGQNLSLAWTGATFPGSYGSLSVVDPSGNTVASTPYASGGNQPNGVFQLTNLQKSGTYTVFMDPYQATTGQIGLQLLAPASGTLTVDGPSLAISQQAGATGRYSFTGTAGQTLGLGLDTLVTTPSGGYASVRVMAPDNVTTLVSCSDVGSAGNSCNLPALPSSGTYTVVVTPGSVNTALTGNLTLSNDAAATLTPNAPVTPFATTRAGQNARYTFSATAGQNLSLAWTGATFPGSYGSLSVVDPSGNTVASTPYASGGNQPNGVFQLTNLQKSGTYTVFMDPYQATTGQIGLQLLAPASGTLTVDGPSLAINQVAGATGRYSFTGTAGQTLGLGLDTLVPTPSGGYAGVRVMAPDNVTTLADCGSFYAPGNSCNLTLPSNGTYTVVVAPSSATTALKGNLTLSGDVTGTLTANAPVTTFATSRVGQNARYTFSATAGQNLSLAWTGSTFPGSYGSLSVIDPSGNAVANTYYVGSGNQPNGVLQLTNLQKSGTYTVFMDPYQTTTGQIGLQLLAPASGTLTVDGPSLAISQQAGAPGRYTFTGTAGQFLNLGFSGAAITPTGSTVTITVIAPDNVTTVVNCGSFSTSGSCSVPALSSTGTNNVGLPSTGTYTVVVTPNSYATAVSGSLSLKQFSLRP